MGGVDHGHPWPRPSLREGAYGVQNRTRRFCEPPSAIRDHPIHYYNKGHPFGMSFIVVVVMGGLEPPTYGL